MSDDLRTIEVAGASIRYRDIGRGEPVLLLHGYPQNHRCWRFQAERLAAHHRVIAPDWFGWGRSTRSRGIAPEYGAEVARVGQLADALGLERFNLAGHDYGGFLALGFALRAPERLLRLCILNSRAHRSFSRAFYRLTALQCLAARTPVLSHLFARMPLHAMHRERLRPYVPRAFSEAELEDYIGWLRGREGRRWLVHFFRHYDVRPRAELDAGLADIALPTAVIWGARDPFCPVAIGEDLAARIPGARLTVLEGADHFVMEEAPRETLAALEAWLGS